MNASRIVPAAVAGFVVMFVINAVAAVVVIDPLFGDDYPEVTGDGSQFDWPLLIGGYLVITIAISLLYTTSAHRHYWLTAGLQVGVGVGLASFAGVHLTQAGYTTIDNTAWVLSGPLDVFGPIVAAITIAYLTDGRTPAGSPAERMNTHLKQLSDQPATKPERLEHQIKELEAVSERVATHLDTLRRQAIPRA